MKPEGSLPSSFQLNRDTLRSILILSCHLQLGLLRCSTVFQWAYMLKASSESCLSVYPRRKAVAGCSTATAVSSSQTVQYFSLTKILHIHTTSRSRSLCCQFLQNIKEGRISTWNRKNITSPDLAADISSRCSHRPQSRSDRPCTYRRTDCVSSVIQGRSYPCVTHHYCAGLWENLT